jgi:hypothetical protein
MAKKPTESQRKLVDFDAQTWHALNLLSRESMNWKRVVLCLRRGPRSRRLQGPRSLHRRALTPHSGRVTTYKVLRRARRY